MRSEEKNEKGEKEKKETVTVIVDNAPHKIDAGTYLVSDFKAMVGVPADKELDRVEQGKLIPLDDSATIEIGRSGGRFVSHVRRGGAS